MNKIKELIEKYSSATGMNQMATRWEVLKALTIYHLVAHFIF